MPKPEKIQEVNSLTEKLKSAKVVLFTDFQLLKAADVTKFRQGIRKCAGEVRVSKNSLITLAYKNLNLEVPQLRGFTGLVIGYEDMLSPARFLVDFVRDKAQLFKIKGGFVEGTFIGANQVFELAAIPNRGVLISKILYTMKAPISNFVNMLNSPMRGLIQVLKMIENEKGGSN